MCLVATWPTPLLGSGLASFKVKQVMARVNRGIFADFRIGRR